MSKDINFIGLSGNLGKDPESRSTPSGKKVVSFSIAVERGFGDSATTDWYNCVCFGQTAEFVEKYLKRGKRVFVSGSLQVRSWEDKGSGQKKYVTEVVADKVQFMDSDRKQDGGAGRQERTAPPARRETTPTPRATAPVSDDPFADDDPDAIPF